MRTRFVHSLPHSSPAAVTQQDTMAMKIVTVLASILVMHMLMSSCMAQLSVGQRCGSCNYGSCRSADLDYNVCKPFFTPCTGVYLGTYILTPATDSQLPILARYDDTECEVLSREYVLECEACNVYGSTCAMFYQAGCVSTWWLWVISILSTCCLLGCCIAAVGLILYQIKIARTNDSDYSPSSATVNVASYGSVAPENRNAYVDQATSYNHGSTVVYQHVGTNANANAAPAPYPFMQQQQQQTAPAANSAQVPDSETPDSF